MSIAIICPSVAHRAVQFLLVLDVAHDYGRGGERVRGIGGVRRRGSGDRDLPSSGQGDPAEAKCDYASFGVLFLLSLVVPPPPSHVLFFPRLDCQTDMWA